MIETTEREQLRHVPEYWIMQSGDTIYNGSVGYGIWHVYRRIKHSIWIACEPWREYLIRITVCTYILHFKPHSQETKFLVKN